MLLNSALFHRLQWFYVITPSLILIMVQLALPYTRLWDESTVPFTETVRLQRARCGARRAARSVSDAYLSGATRVPFCACSGRPCSSLAPR